MIPISTRVVRSALLRPSDAESRVDRRLLSCSALPKRAPTTLERFGPVLLASSVVAAHLLTHPSGAFAAVDSLPTEPPPLPQELYQLAENEDFWANMARYSRFFVSVMVGSAYVILKPFTQLLKRPLTAAALLGGAVLFYFFISTTLKAMLGLEGTEF